MEPRAYQRYSIPETKGAIHSSHIPGKRRVNAAIRVFETDDDFPERRAILPRGVCRITADSIPSIAISFELEMMSGFSVGPALLFGQEIDQPLFALTFRFNNYVAGSFVEVKVSRSRL